MLRRSGRRDAVSRPSGSRPRVGTVSVTELATHSADGALQHKHSLRQNVLILIERGDRHQILNTGPELLRTLNIYVPPTYTKGGKTLPKGRR
jgi:mannose-6-phosphate isomerase-like protein (cupin superfamily)